MNVFERFQAAACARAGEIAVVDAGREWTFREIDRTAAAIAEEIASIGSGEPGRRVGVYLPPSGRYPAACLGIWAAGGVVVPLNSFLSPTELSAIIDDAGMTVVLTEIAISENIRHPTVMKILLDNVDLAVGGATRAAAAREDDCAVVIYTSGSESAPKGVMLSHRNLLSNVEGCAKVLRLEGRGVFAIVPLFHSFGFTGGMLFPLLTGSVAVIPAGFNPAAVLRALRDRRIGAVITVPSIYRMLAKVAAAHGGGGTDRPPFPEICVAGGEPLPDAVADQFENIFGAPLLNGYGMTETSPVVALSTPGARRRGTVGRPLPGVEVGIAEDGEIRVRGPNVMMGYLNKPEATRAIKSDDGWLATGDVGALDADGYLSIVDRKKDLIISSGENISPSEIEGVIAQHPAVAEAAVVGMADATKGEVPRAVLALREGASVAAEEIVAFCRERLAPFKVPRQVEFRPALPRNAIGKVMKRALK